VLRDGFEEAGVQDFRRLVDLLPRDPPAVVEGPPEGDQGEPAAGRLGIPLAGLSRRRVEGVGQPRRLRVQAVFQDQEIAERREGPGGGQRLQDLEGKRGDAEEGEPRTAQGAPPPSW
jgi:hypothetical protein